MKLSIQKEDLFYAVSAVERGISAKNTIQVLSGVLIQAKGDRIRFRATDMDLALECVVSGQIEEEGEVVVPGRRFAALTRLLPSGTVVLSGDNDRLSVEYGCGRQNIPCFSPEEFPALPERSGDVEGSVYAGVFRKMVRRVGIAAAADEIRPVFTGLYTEFAPDRLTMVATDTHRLAKGSGRWQGTAGNAVLIPGRAAQEVARLAADDEENILITVGRNQVFFSFANIVITSRLIMGQYPDYQQVIPADELFKTEFSANRHALIEILERAFLIARENSKVKGNAIRLDLLEDAIVISAEVPDEGTLRESLDATVKGEQFQVSYNARYLLDALKNMESETVRMQLTGPNTSAVLTGAEEEDYLYLLLPIRTVRP